MRAADGRSFAFLTLVVLLTACIPELAIPAPEKNTECTNEGGLEILVQAYPPCEPAVCNGDVDAAKVAHCLPVDLVTPADRRKDLVPCLGGGLCVPDGYIVNDGRYTPKTCRAGGGIEGRCLSVCLAQIRDQAQLIEQSGDTGCAPGEKCAPCYDARIEDLSDSCTTSDCDKAKEDEPAWCDLDYTASPALDIKAAGLKPCAPDICPLNDPSKPEEAVAHCFPLKELVKGKTKEEAKQLEIDLFHCDPDTMCVPDELLATGGHVKKTAANTCVSTAGLEGRCQSICLKGVADKKDLLPESTCAAGKELCAPCYDLSKGKWSGACTASSCDENPGKEPERCGLDYSATPLVDVSKYATCPSNVCAEGGARCFAKTNVDEADAYDDRGEPVFAECDATHWCMPENILAAGGNVPTATCTSLKGAEGRCQSLCLPGVAEQKATLPSEGCDAERERCVPCFDPLQGGSTGACDTSCDKPTQPKVVFEPCCTASTGAATGGTQAYGVCLPRSLVTTGADSLTKQECTGSDELCTPRAYAEDQDYVYPTCSDPVTGEGRCVSACVNTQGQGKADDECVDNTVCVPCSVKIDLGVIIPGLPPIDIDTGVCK